VGRIGELTYKPGSSSPGSANPGSHWHGELLPHQPPAERTDDLEIKYAHNPVYFRDLLNKGSSIALGKAARHDQYAAPALFKTGAAEYVVQRFLFGNINKAAGIYNYYFCVKEIPGKPEPGPPEYALHDFPVHAVFGTAQIVKSYAKHDKSNKKVHIPRDMDLKNY
jgi:hypothetical protein